MLIIDMNGGEWGKKGYVVATVISEKCKNRESRRRRESENRLLHKHTFCKCKKELLIVMFWVYISLVFVMVWFLWFPVLCYSYTFLCLLLLPVSVLLPTPVSHRLVSTSPFPCLSTCTSTCTSLVWFVFKHVLFPHSLLVLCFRPRVGPVFLICLVF